MRSKIDDEGDNGRFEIQGTVGSIADRDRLVDGLQARVESQLEPQSDLPRGWLVHNARNKAHISCLDACLKEHMSRRPTEHIHRMWV